MVRNCYEYTIISHKDLPQEWQHQAVLDDFESFLQQNWEQRAVFYEDGDIVSKQQFLEFLSHGRVKSKNYIGTIIFRGVELNIFPKMFRSDIDDCETDQLSKDHLMKNLVNWLTYCNKSEYPFVNISSNLKDLDNLKDLFVYLYISYVRHAIERGFYYQYIEQTENTGVIKGKLDIKDYITSKIPNKQADRFKCTYSNFEFDNKLNQIIKYTCKLLLNYTNKSHYKILRNILIKLDRVSDVYCLPSDCDKIKLSKLHKNYRIILSMSKMLMLNKVFDAESGIQNSFCFLFPTELLFEGFIGGYIQEYIESSNYGKVKLQQSEMCLVDDIQYLGQSLGSAFKMRHDIVVEVNNKIFILDTKYKEISRFDGNANDVRKIVSEEPRQIDVYQVCEYARKRGSSDVYLLYPLYRFEDLEEGYPKAISGDINIHFVRIPFIFEDDVEKLKNQLSKVIRDIFDLT